ncbi:MAG: hypothetical protein ACREQ9_00010, partial [Candidatus Binatia bacterium]
VEDHRMRFPNLLQAMLADRCLVMTVAGPGWDTRRELSELERFPYPADLVVLGYVGNDVSGAAAELGRLPSVPEYGGLDGTSRAIVSRSYALDFIYWLLPARDGGWYARALRSLYEDPAVFGAHAEDLRKLVERIRERRARLVVVLFPFLEDVGASEFFVEPVERFFRGQAVPVLSVAELVAGRRSDELIVNRSDTHPSELVHRLIADALHELLAKDDPCIDPPSPH